MLFDRMNRITLTIVRHDISVIRQCSASPPAKILFILSVILFILSMDCSSSCRAQDKNKSSAVERITENVYRVGKALVDTRARTVTCPGQINMDEGAIEYLAVAPRGKTHESLLLLDVRPLHLQLALLLLDLEPKNVLSRQGDKATPQGAPVLLTIRWHDAQGNLKETRAEDLISEMPANKPMPAHAWVFTGSRITPAGFEADLQKSLIAVWHDPAAILDNPLPGGANNAYVINARRVPRHGTAIELIFKAADKPKEEPGK